MLLINNIIHQLFLYQLYIFKCSVILALTVDTIVANYTVQFKEYIKVLLLLMLCFIAMSSLMMDGNRQQQPEKIAATSAGHLSQTLIQCFEDKFIRNHDDYQRKW
jgi:hypothetical protein